MFHSCVRQRVGFYFDVSDAISASIFRGVAVNCNLINSHFPEDGRGQCVRNVKPKTNLRMNTRIKQKSSISKSLSL